MILSDNLLRDDERITFTLRQLYHDRGYRPYRMSKFEEYDFYARNKEFLVSDQVITFTDTSGRLMAMKPDVTLSIIKNSRDNPDRLEKVYYVENVYRISQRTDAFQELLQTGLECFGNVNRDSILEVLQLAAKSMELLSPTGILELSDLTLLEQLVDRLGLGSEDKAAVYTAIGEKNTNRLEELLARCPDPSGSGPILKELMMLSGSIRQVLPRLRELIPPGEEAAVLFEVLEQLDDMGLSHRFRVDFSNVGDTNYYNGLIFHGYISGIPASVLSGGQYDRLMEKLGRRSRAIGFAVYLDLLTRMETEAQDSGWLNVALPKGRLGEKVYAMFARSGFDCPAILEQNRKLIFENPEKKLRFFWVKPSDVAIYVERGAADIGVAGKDILLEYAPDVYELLDLGIGKCRMAVAGPRDFRDDPGRTLRVATKFGTIAKRYYQSLGRDIDMIHLNGSIEIAPILGLSDVIVDIVETGTTLRENNLEVLETIVPISARFIANKASYKFKQDRIRAVAAGLSTIVEEKA